MDPPKIQQQKKDLPKYSAFPKNMPVIPFSPVLPYMVGRNLAIAEVQTITTRQNLVQLRQQNHDLSRLASLYAVLNPQKFFQVNLQLQL
jgi:hypothetical protein